MPPPSRDAMSRVGVGGWLGQKLSITGRGECPLRSRWGEAGDGVLVMLLLLLLELANVEDPVKGVRMGEVVRGYGGEVDSERICVMQDALLGGPRVQFALRERELSVGIAVNRLLSPPAAARPTYTCLRPKSKWRIVIEGLLECGHPLPHTLPPLPFVLAN